MGIYFKNSHHAFEGAKLITLAYVIHGYAVPSIKVVTPTTSKVSPVDMKVLQLLRDNIIKKLID